MNKILTTIKNIREQKKISQKEMAEKLGIAQNNYSKLERGEVSLTVERLFSIADILQVAVNAIIDNEEKTNELFVNSIEHLKKRISNLEVIEENLEKQIKEKDKLIGFQSETSLLKLSAFIHSIKNAVTPVNEDYVMEWLIRIFLHEMAELPKKSFINEEDREYIIQKWKSFERDSNI